MVTRPTPWIEGAALRTLFQRAPIVMGESMDHKSKLPVRVLSFPRWCELSGFSTRTGRRLIVAGKGPRIIQLSDRRIGVREDGAARWLESRVR